MKAIVLLTALVSTVCPLLAQDASRVEPLKTTVERLKQDVADLKARPPAAAPSTLAPPAVVKAAHAFIGDRDDSGTVELSTAAGITHRFYSNGQASLFELSGSSRPAGAILSVPATGIANLRLNRADGAEGAFIGATGSLHLYNTQKQRVFEFAPDINGSGQLKILPASTSASAILRSTADSTWLQLSGANGQTAAVLASGTSVGHGFVRLNRSDGKEVAYLGATDKGIGLLNLENNADKVVLNARSDDTGAGWFDLSSPAGAVKLTLKADKDLGWLSVVGSGTTTGAGIYGWGGMRVYKDDGQTAASLEVTPGRKGGWFGLYNSSSKTVVAAGAADDTGAGYLNVSAPGGESKVILGAVGDLGAISLNGTGKFTTALISGNGYARFYRTEDGKQTAYIGESTQGSGVMQVNNAEAKAVVEASVSGGGDGQLTIFNKAGANMAELWVDNTGQGTLTINGHSQHDYADVFDFDPSTTILPGSVVSIADDGESLLLSKGEYDRQVVGVVSGAGNLHAAATIGSASESRQGLPIAVAGQVFVRVNAEGGAIRPGDLLTPSSRPGVAMRAADPARSTGAIVGKALGRFAAGSDPEGLVRMLVMNR